MSREVYQFVDGDEVVLQLPVQVTGHRPIPANAVCTVHESLMCPTTGNRLYDVHCRIRAVEHSHTKDLHFVGEAFIVHDHFDKVVAVNVARVLYSKILNEDGSQRRISSNVKIVKTTVDDDSVDDRVYQ
jgi:hypothetical protein